MLVLVVKIVCFDFFDVVFRIFLHLHIHKGEMVLPSTKLYFNDNPEQPFNKKMKLIEIIHNLAVEYDFKLNWQDFDLKELEKCLDDAGIQYFRYLKHKYGSK